MKVIHTKTEIKKTETETVFEMAPKYFWRSRSVYAVEFNGDIYNAKEDDVVWNEMVMIQVEFEKNIIHCEKFTFSEEHPLREEVMDYKSDWLKELLHAFLNEGYYTTRTKENFDNDYNGVIKYLQNLRK